MTRTKPFALALSLSLTCSLALPSVGFAQEPTPADPAAAETQTDTEVQPQIAAQTGETDDTAQTIAAQPAATQQLIWVGLRASCSRSAISCSSAASIGASFTACRLIGPTTETLRRKRNSNISVLSVCSAANISAPFFPTLPRN